jgi:hypothetical protein
MNAVLLYGECILLNLTQLYELNKLSNTFFLNIQKFKFNDDYCKRAKQINIYIFNF